MGRAFDDEMSAVGKSCRTSSALLTGVRASNVPLMNKVGTRDFTGLRNTAPRSGTFQARQISGKGRSINRPSRVCFSSRRTLAIRSGEAPDAQSMVYDIMRPNGWRRNCRTR